MKILIIEDDPVTRLLIVRTMSQWGHEVIEAESGEQAIEIVEANLEQAPNLLITDWSLPHMSGLEVCKYLKSSLKDHFFYVIMLTRKAESEDLVEAMEEGVDDYMVKPFAPEEFRVRVRAGMRIVEQAQKLQFLASHDELTELWNRRMVMHHLEMEWQRTLRDGLPMSIMMMDIDHFKSINDNYGHLVGDAALKHFADIIRKVLRPYDIVGRYGGEEFLTILPETDREQAKQVAERVRSSLEQSPLVIDQNHKMTMTVSIGIAQSDQTTKNIKCILGKGDEAMYQAKTSGRNKVVVAES